MQPTDASKVSQLEFAARERVEREAFLDFFAAAPPEVVARFGINFGVEGGVALLAAREIPTFEMNRVVGLGVEGPATEGRLEAAIGWARDHCNPSFAVQVAPGASPPALLDWLSDRDFQPVGHGWVKLWRGATPIVAHSITTPLRVREAGRGDVAAFGDVFASAFGLPVELSPWISAMVGRPKVRPYLAYDGATPVAVGLLYAGDGWGWLGFGGTLADHRGRGAQSALLERRLADGIAMGLKGFTIETGRPLSLEDRGASSYRNILRAGFEAAYVRQNYGPRADRQ